MKFMYIIFTGLLIFNTNSRAVTGDRETTGSSMTLPNESSKLHSANDYVTESNYVEVLFEKFKDLNNNKKEATAGQLFDKYFYVVKEDNYQIIRFYGLLLTDPPKAMFEYLDKDKPIIFSTFYFPGGEANCVYRLGKKLREISNNQFYFILAGECGSVCTLLTSYSNHTTVVDGELSIHRGRAHHTVGSILIWGRILSLKETIAVYKKFEADSEWLLDNPYLLAKDNSFHSLTQYEAINSGLVQDYNLDFDIPFINYLRYNDILIK